MRSHPGQEQRDPAQPRSGHPHTGFRPQPGQGQRVLPQLARDQDRGRRAPSPGRIQPQSDPAKPDHERRGHRRRPRQPQRDREQPRLANVRQHRDREGTRQPGHPEPCRARSRNGHPPGYPAAPDRRRQDRGPPESSQSERRRRVRGQREGAPQPPEAKRRAPLGRRRLRHRERQGPSSPATARFATPTSGSRRRPGRSTGAGTSPARTAIRSSARTSSVADGRELRPLARARRLDRLATDAKQSAKTSPLDLFSEPVRRWFEASFEAPTPAQDQGWPAIASGANTLICAPTGSGKTLTAFLWGIDKLSRDEEQLGQGVKLVYVSPLKALSYDVERNLRAPLKGIGAPISVGLRTGDTPQKDRQAMLRKPPDILITTPESLYLMMTSQARNILAGVEAVIVDEIHAVAADQARRPPRAHAGAARASGPDPRGRPRPGRDGPADRPLGHAAPARAGRVVPGRAEARVHDRRRRHPQGARPRDRRPGRGHDAARVASARRSAGDGDDVDFDAAPTQNSIWPAIYPKLLELVQSHTSTIIFVNARRAAERLAKRLNELANELPEQELPATEHAGTRRASARRGGLRRGRPRPPRLARPRGAPGDRGDAEGRRSCPAWSRPPRSSWGSTWAPWTS